MLRHSDNCSFVVMAQWSYLTSRYVIRSINNLFLLLFFLSEPFPRSHSLPCMNHSAYWHPHMQTLNVGHEVSEQQVLWHKLTIFIPNGLKLWHIYIYGIFLGQVAIGKGLCALLVELAREIGGLILEVFGRKIQIRELEA